MSGKILTLRQRRKAARGAPTLVARKLRVRTREFLPRCSGATRRQPVLEKFFPDGDWPTVHVYSNRGKPADAPAYAKRFDQVMAAGLAGWGRAT